MKKILTAEELEQLAVAEAAVAVAKRNADAAEAFCFSCGSTSVSMDARLSMRATRFVADKAEEELSALLNKLKKTKDAWGVCCNGCTYFNQPHKPCAVCKSADK